MVKSNTLRIVVKECEEGTTTCIGYDLYRCINGRWVLIKTNAPECGYEAPPTIPTEYLLIGAAAIGIFTMSMMYIAMKKR